MKLSDKAALNAIAPYAAWMAFMFMLPANAANYALRTAVASLLLVPFLRSRRFMLPSFKAVFAGLLAGVAVCVLWVVPEHCGWDWYREWMILGGLPAEGEASPYDPSVCGWPLTLARLVGSAFVIAPIEEIFFRDFLYRRLQRADWQAVDRRVFDLSAFLWMTALFALEHNRIVVGALAGAAYGLLYMRFGLFSAALAHVITNLLLALYVIFTGNWAFW